MTVRILVVEDEKAIQLALSGLLRRAGYQVDLADDGDSAIKLLNDGFFDLVLTDLALGKGKDGMDVLKAAKKQCEETAVVMITAHGSERIAVEAMKEGAEDYIPKPFDNDEIRVVITRALQRYRLERENRLLLEQIQREYGFQNLIGSVKAMRQVFETIQKVAQTDLTVLIRGESGTGKELVAKALHNTSNRKKKPFVAVNCAAISSELVESELFGHEKGAFTGADSRRIGRFESADGGTLLLDEIGDMPMDTQAKVLRVLQEHSFERVGGNRTVQVDVRVVAATHRNLEREVRAGNFRDDLFYRLNVVQLHLPSLSQRREDIPALAERFLEQIAKRLDREKKHLSAGAMTRLMAHSWPGNVRELRNVIEQAFVLSNTQVIDESELNLMGEIPFENPLKTSFQGLPFAEAKRNVIEQFERGFILNALRTNKGNVSHTAHAIGMVRQSLQHKIRELGLRTEDWSSPDKKGEV